MVLSDHSQNPELTSTLHLGLREVVSDSPAGHIANLLAEASPEEKAVIGQILDKGDNSAMVIVHRGPSKGARFLLDSDSTSIGRASDCDIFLDDVTVSRKHASIVKNETSFSFVDAGSLNGSYINNEAVSSRELHNGDEIQIGKFHMLFIRAEVKK